jgi:cystathionine beta-lyase
MDALLGDCSLAKLRRRKSFKWRTYPDDVLPAFVAEMDFDLAEPIKDAVRAALDDGDCGYADKGDLGTAFAAFAAERLAWSPDPDLIFAIPDVMTGIAETIVALTPPGAGIAINPPVYPPFFFRLRQLGRHLVEAPLHRDDGAASGGASSGGAASGGASSGGSRYDLDLEVLDKVLAADDVRAYLLCSPHNPVGRVWSREQLTAVADCCARHDTLLIVDEIHAPLVLPGARHVPFLSLDHEVAERTIVMSSASKAWNIPGLKCGVAVAGSPAIAAVVQEHWQALLAAHLGVLATVAAFTSGQPWLDAMLAQIDENRTLLQQLLREHLPAVGYVPPEASFLAWLDCRRLGLGDDPAAAFLADGRVALAPGPDFGEQGRGYARLNMGTSPALLTEAVERMAKAAG